jgi:hypothetical protein
MPLKNQRAFESQLHLIDLLIGCCESALRFTNLDTLEDSFRNARKSYAAALRNTGHLALSVQDARDFEARTIRLEAAILRVEQRCSAAQGRHKQTPAKTHP